MALVDQLARPSVIAAAEEDLLAVELEVGAFHSLIARSGG